MPSFGCHVDHGSWAFRPRSLENLAGAALRAEGEGQAASGGGVGSKVRDTTTWR